MGAIRGHGVGAIGGHGMDAGVQLDCIEDIGFQIVRNATDCGRSGNGCANRQLMDK